MDKPLPYISAALLCERIIQEKDEGITLVRIIDKLQYEVQGVQLPPGVRPAIPLSCFVSLKSGAITGSHTIKIAIERPNGQRKDILEHSFDFLGKDHGQNLIVRMTLGVEQDGLHWFDVLFDGETLTRIPIVISPLPKQELPEQKS